MNRRRRRRSDVDPGDGERDDLQPPRPPLVLYPTTSVDSPSVRPPAPPAERLILSRLSAHGTGPEPEEQLDSPPWVPSGLDADWRRIAEATERERAREDLSSVLRENDE
jgi:hypothetical protein